MRDQTTYLATETIRSLREQRGLTQRSLAEAIGVTDKAISKWDTEGVKTVQGTPHRKTTYSQVDMAVYKECSQRFATVRNA